MTHLTRSLVLGCSLLALAACGPEEIASPGGGNITIDNSVNNPAPTPTPTPTSTPTPSVTPAAGCPTIAATPGLTDQGTITGPTGEYRVCALPAVFNSSATLPYVSGLLYLIDGQVDVGTDQGAATSNTAVTLTVEPGAIFYASGSDYLNVNRGNRLNAIGQADRPIIFTSRDNVLGLNNENSSGQWGGVILNGRAPITDCRGAGATPGTVGCERAVEGTATPPLYGGATPTDSSGTLSYVQIRYSGFILSNGDELQSLTTGGIGSGTTLDHIMSYNSSDDGAEFFGGNVNGRYFAIVGAEDDTLDTDTGVKANFQYVLGIQRAGFGDTIIEADTTNGLIEDMPRQNTQISNATFIQNSAAGAAAVRLRGGTDYALINTLVVSKAGVPCLRVDDAQTVRAADAALDDVGPPVFQSVLFDCGTAPTRDGSGGGWTAAAALTAFDAGTNTDSAFVNSLTNGYINGASETAATASDPTALSTFFATPTGGDYVGAVRDATTDWTQGWTCNSGTVNFGTNTGDCSSLPVYN